METREVQDKRRTVSFAASAEGTKVVFSENYKYYHFRNDGGGTVYVSAYSDVGEGVDGTKSIADGGCGYVFSGDDHVFVKGAAKITVEASNLPECPFKSAQRGGDITAKGNPVQIDGLQGGVPFSEMVVSGKNLLTYPYNETTKTVNGITFTDNGDGSVTVKGTATARCAFWLKQSVDNFVLPKNTPIYISAAKEQIPNVNIGCGLINGTTWISSKAFSITGAVDAFDYENFDRLNFNITVDPGSTVDVTLYPQIELGETPTEYEPPITGRDLTVNVSGKNLIPYPYAETTKTVNGITFTDNGDGSIIANGTSTAQIWFTIFNNVTFNCGTYTLSGNQSGGKLKYDTNLIWKDNNGNEHWVVDAGDGITFTLPYQVTIKILLRIYKGITVENLVFRPQLEIGTVATAYEPYHGSTNTIKPDSNPYVITNDIRQQDGLNVVSVSEGELSVMGVRKNAALKRIWDEIDEIKTAIIVSNGESE